MLVYSKARQLFPVLFFPIPHRLQLEAHPKPNHRAEEQAMILYSHIEERYCPHCRENVGVEYVHKQDGTVTSRCLSRTCQEEFPEEGCRYNTAEG